MFVVIYQPSDAMIKIEELNEELIMKGEWKVDTSEDGSVSHYDDLETALDRVKKIRSSGGEACLAVIIE